MKDFLLGLRIRVKLLAAFGSILLLSVLLIVFSISSINRIIRYKAINEDVDRLKLYLETLELSSKNFLYEEFKTTTFLDKGVSPATESFDSSYQEVKKIIGEIHTSGVMDAEATSVLTRSLMTTLDSLHTDFRLLTQLLKTRGFRDYGLEGSLRKAIHEVENSGLSFDMTDMLMLRRHEKDFFLRKDLKYQKEFIDRFEKFRTKTAESNGGLLIFLDNYRIEFDKVVAIERQIGLKENEGIRGRIQQYLILFRPQIETFRAFIKKRNDEQIARTKLVLLVIFSAQIIAGLVMALVYAGLLTKSIKEIRGAMKKLADGIFPDKLVVRTTEEIGQTKEAFNQFVDRLQCATSFAEHLGSGELNFQYNNQYADDVLAKSLITAQTKLREADDRQSRINWINEGVAKFNDVLKNDSGDMNLLADSILKLLVYYVKANQGVLYKLVNEQDETYLERIATYAYARKRFVQQRVPLGEGAIGQCVLGTETIYLTDVPSDFVKITSGLGEATPRNVIMIPLKYQARVMGAIELASFQKLESFQVEFLEKIAESIATLLSNRQVAAETKELLHQSEQRASVLAQQEEEMRQNAEELQATQEEMERQRTDMQEEIRRLREKLASVLTEV